MKQLIIKLYRRYVNEIYIPSQCNFFVMEHLRQEGIEALVKDNFKVFRLHKGKGHVVISTR